MIEFITNPWFIVTVIVCFLVGNFAALKYTDTKRYSFKKTDRRADIKRLIELHEKKYPNEKHQDEQNKK